MIKLIINIIGFLTLMAAAMKTDQMLIAIIISVTILSGLIWEKED